MAREEHKSLIYNLYENMTGFNAKDTTRSRYKEDTKGLDGIGSMHEKVTISDTAESSVEDAFVCVSPDVYDRLLNAKMSAIVAPRPKGIILGEQIRIEELKGLAKTGKYMFKTVTDIRSSIDTDGLKEGYVLISFSPF